MFFAGISEENLVIMETGVDKADTLSALGTADRARAIPRKPTFPRFNVSELTINRCIPMLHFLESRESWNS